MSLLHCANVYMFDQIASVVIWPYKPHQQGRTYHCHQIKISCLFKYILILVPACLCCAPHAASPVQCPEQKKSKKNVWIVHIHWPLAIPEHIAHIFSFRKSNQWQTDGLHLWSTAPPNNAMLKDHRLVNRVAKSTFLQGGNQLRKNIVKMLRHSPAPVSMWTYDSLTGLGKCCTWKHPGLEPCRRPVVSDNKIVKHIKNSSICIFILWSS